MLPCRRLLHERCRRVSLQPREQLAGSGLPFATLSQPWGVTRMSKKAGCCRVQKPVAAMSSLASDERLTVRPGTSSPVIGSNGGSTRIVVYSKHPRVHTPSTHSAKLNITNITYLKF